MLTFQQDRIAKLKAHFAKASKILPYEDLGREGALNKSTMNPDERLMNLQALLISQLTMLAQTSLDQVAVALEITRHLEFFGNDIFKLIEVANAEHENNGFVVKTYYDASEKHLVDAKGLYGEHCKHIISVYDSMDYAQRHKHTKALEAGIVKEAQLYFEIKDELEELGGREGKNRALYDEDQVPRLRGISPQKAMHDLYEATVENTERVISQNIEYATTLLVKRQLIQNRIMPSMPHLRAEWDEEIYAGYAKVKGVIDHIGTLSRIHADRSALFEAKFA